MFGGIFYNILFGLVEDCCRDCLNFYYIFCDVKFNNIFLDEMLFDFGVWSVFIVLVWCMELVLGEKVLCFNLLYV